jgi:8-oxo-dGTP diphosphatase
MKLTTVCYIENDDKYLMLHRTKKENDENGGKWIGIGGKFEFGETPFDCVRREVLEETGLTLINPKHRGIVTFVSNVFGTEYMHLFTCSDYSGELKEECDEGELDWVDIDKLHTLPMWDGDKIFHELLLKEDRFFSLKLEYDGDNLKNYKVEY